MAKGQAKKTVSTKSHAIEKIIKSRSSGNSLEYFIKWKDSPDAENSWESVNDLFSLKKTVNASEVVMFQDSPPEKINSTAMESDEATRKRSVGTKTVTKTTTTTRNKSKTPLQNQEVDRVENLRKRNNKHEYLVKWKSSDQDDEQQEEWISRDTMIANHAKSVIAFFERITSFKTADN
ncbi:heterochromatin protein 1-like [Contarinia nasturtii]|uniref:heterochromatin protein 1-like n=1 Tax=Contarinia nasturtii TaxID=265458 RepID=UPI0012D4A7AA|nr:heterochromatin protein 1-like [Contarinia nasturtii]